MVSNASKRPASLFRLLADPRLMLWSAACIVSAPVLLLLKLRRYLRNRFKFEFNMQRWWVHSLTPERLEDIKRSGARHVVFVGGGIGELQMVDRVAKELVTKSPGIRITYCFRDPTTVLLLQQRPDLNVAFWPFDFIVPVAKWLRLQQPDLLVFTERFRFTTFSCAAARLGVRVALMNGRCRPRNSNLYRLVGFVYRWQFGAFKVMAMQRKDYFERAKAFASCDCKLVLTGDIKADLSSTVIDPQRQAELRAWLDGSEPILAAGSTESLAEEEMVLESFLSVRQKTPCRLLVAPRQLARKDELVQLLTGRGLRVSLRSSPQSDADAYVLDTLGELRFAYSLCAAAYVGGSFGKKGGHNVMEPLEWGLPVAYGMTRGYFEALQTACEKAGLGTRVSGSEDLEGYWEEMLHGDHEALAIRAKALLEESRGAVSATAELLSELLNEGRLTSPSPESSAFSVSRA